MRKVFKGHKASLVHQEFKASTDLRVLLVLVVTTVLPGLPVRQDVRVHRGRLGHKVHLVPQDHKAGLARQLHRALTGRKVRRDQLVRRGTMHLVKMSCTQ